MEFEENGPAVHASKAVNHQNTETRKNKQENGKNMHENVLLPPSKIICAGFIFRSDSNGAW